MPVFGRRIQLVPGRKRDPAAEPDQGDAGSRIDELAEALSDSDAGAQTAKPITKVDRTCPVPA